MMELGQFVVVIDGVEIFKGLARAILPPLPPAPRPCDLSMSARFRLSRARQVGRSRKKHYLKGIRP